MAVTLLANVINPEVMADMVSAKLPTAIKFSNSIAQIDSTLVGRAGDTITIPVWAYIGNAADLAEGVADVPVALSASDSTHTVKKIAKSIAMTDETALSGLGDPLGQAADQLAMSIAKKIDVDVLTALKTTALVAGNVANVITHGQVVAGIMAFEDEEIGERKFLFVNPNQYGELQLDTKFTDATPEMLRSGVVGMIAGCEVIVSKDIVNGFPIVAKPGAVLIYMKRDVNIETDRDILAKTTTIAADEHYVAVLADASKAVKLSVKPTV